MPPEDEVPPLVPTWSPKKVASFIDVARPVLKRWYRSEVHGLEHMPEGGSLIVSNHSGGTLTMDFPVFLVDWCARFGLERPCFLLSHAVLFRTPLAEWLRGIGLVPAHRDAAHTILTSGATLMVFPGGDYDVSRPSTSANTIDFDGRVGYVRTALKADVPIVPMVSIGGQESQVYLTRGATLARWMRLPQLARIATLPITFGFPWGPSVLGLPPNIPFPTKIITQVLEPVDLRAEFGDDPDSQIVDSHIRKLMQSALDEMARKRRFPVLG
ncbi:lysophospholipid acyltransferase family protein [Mycolicibacterium hodleri]